MIQNRKIVYDSEGEIVCSPIVPSDFRTTLTGVRVTARPTCTMQVKVEQTGLLRASICAHARNSVAVKLPVRTVPVLEMGQSVFGRGTS